ncbi:MAG TPA: response regulator [Acidobacteriaceae bacterium]|nr:response regulator [Acidobacteriaceae bacterium]
MKPSMKVFVVDDEPIIATTLAMILRRVGFEVDFFTVPAEALTAAEINRPHLLVSDVMMPGLSGVDLAIRIRAMCPECKIILISGQATTNDLLKDARHRGYDFMLLQKPFHPTDLLAAIRRMDS